MISITDKKDVERVSKPWGYELIWAKTERYAGKVLHIDAGKRLSLQYHEEKEETIYVLSGVLKLHIAAKVGDTPTIMELGEGEAFHIPPGLIHRFEATDDVDLLETSTTELDDVVRLEDDFDRASS